MSHELIERYSKLVDAKLRASLIKKDGVIFNNRYEGNPTAGAVKVPVRDTEVAVNAYSKTDGANPTHGDTSYIIVPIDKDYAVNEIIDGFDAAAVPDNLVADRLDSAGYSLALQIENDATSVLVSAATKMSNTEASTVESAYNNVVDARAALSKVHVPNDGKRFLLAHPDFYALILKDTEHFTHATDLGDAVIATGAVGKIGGFLVFEDYTLPEGVEFIVGHPNWCTRVNEWMVPVKIQDLSGSGKYIGASAVQGRRVYAHKVTKAKTLLKKTNA